MTDETLRLDNQLCFPLYACARKVVGLYTPFLEKLKLTYTQYLVLLVLWETDNLCIKALGNRLFLDSGTLTPLLKKMEQHGLLVRNRAPQDERSVIVSLTDAGKALRKDALGIPPQLAQCMPLSLQDATTLHALLHRMLKQF